MKKVGIVGINIAHLPSLSGTEALKQSGGNFGNMLFTKAAHEQIENSKHIGFSWDPAKLREEISAILIPAANWLNHTQDWDSLAKLIEKTNLPVTIVGLGSQIKNISEVCGIPTGTKKLLLEISERCHTIGVRGDFTAEVVRACGVKNVEVLGCPSIFSDGVISTLRDISTNTFEKIAIGPTRYNLQKTNNQNRFNKQRQLYQFAIRDASSIYYQSEQYEIQLLSGETQSFSDEVRELAKKYYGVAKYNHLEHKILSKGKYHTDRDHWIADVAKDDIYIGTRIHGAIAATLAGTPAILITHDQRTRELADFMAVPSIPIDDFEIEQLYDIPYLVRTLDYEKFMRRSEQNFKRLKSFYAINNLSTTLNFQ